MAWPRDCGQRGRNRGVGPGAMSQAGTTDTHHVTAPVNVRQGILVGACSRRQRVATSKRLPATSRPIRLAARILKRVHAFQQKSAHALQPASTASVREQAARRIQSSAQELPHATQSRPNSLSGHGPTGRPHPYR